MKKQFKKMMAIGLMITSAMGMGAAPAFAGDVNTTAEGNGYVERAIVRSTSYEITANNVRLRATPSLSGGVVAYLQKGDIVASLNDTVYADGYTWVAIQCVNCSDASLNGTPAWVASNYLHEIG